MSRVRPYPVTILIVWTLVVWLGRLPLAWNVAGDSTGRKILATVPVALFVGFALAALVGLWRHGAPNRDDERRARATRDARRAVATLVVWTVFYWLVRLPMISTDAHDLAFKAVHLVLGLVSFALSAWVWRSTLTRHSTAWEMAPTAPAPT